MNLLRRRSQRQGTTAVKTEREDAEVIAREDKVPQQISAGSITL